METPRGSWQSQSRAQRLSLLPAAGSASDRHCTRHTSRTAFSNQEIPMCVGLPITALCRQQRPTPHEAALPTPLPPWRWWAPTTLPGGEQEGGGEMGVSGILPLAGVPNLRNFTAPAEPIICLLGRVPREVTGTHRGPMPPCKCCSCCHFHFAFAFIAPGHQ